ncbi:MAG: hypothetical protein E7302_16710 [Butyrivibrio sp.]|nr:hypothetical protein [Butyrivibrio sp.]
MRMNKIFKKILVFVMALVIAFTAAIIIPTGDGNVVYAASIKKQQANAYKKIIAMKKKYPEGTKWNDSNKYKGKTACQAWALLMSDTAYGKNAKYYQHYDFGDLKVGDIIYQVPGSTTSDGATTSGTHALVVLKVDYKNDKLVLCEGNFGGKVHWDAELTISEFASRCGASVLSRFKHSDSRSVKVKKPGNQTSVTYKYEDGYGHFYAKKMNCSAYQFVISDNSGFPYDRTETYYSSVAEDNYIYWEGDKSLWTAYAKNHTAYVKVRSVNIKGGYVSYGKWSKVLTVK